MRLVVEDARRCAYERLLPRWLLSKASAIFRLADEKMASTVSVDPPHIWATSFRENPTINNMQIRRSSADSSRSI
jgi:hypothetical protein